MCENNSPKLSGYFTLFTIGSFLIGHGNKDRRFSGWIEILAINCWKEFIQLLKRRMRELLLLWIRSSQNLRSRRRSVSRSRKPRKRTSFCEDHTSPSQSTTTFELLALMMHVFDYADLFFATLRDDNIQDFDTRSDEVLLLSMIPSDDVLESIHKLKLRETENF